MQRSDWSRVQKLQIPHHADIAPLILVIFYLKLIVILFKGVNYSIFQDSINDIFEGWRTCIQKLLGLPYRTHCALIPEIIFTYIWLFFLILEFCNKGDLADFVLRNAHCQPR